jgi:hypothetical protein
MCGITPPPGCTKRIICEIKYFFRSFSRIAAATLPGAYNRYTRKVEYFPNSKRVKIYSTSGGILDLPEGPNNKHTHLLEGAKSNFWEVVNNDQLLDYDGNKDNDTIHPLYPFLMNNELFKDSVVKTIL